MQRAPAEPSPVASISDIRRHARQHNDLVGLAGPVLEVVLRVQAKLDTPSDDLRHKIDDLLKDMERRGALARYDAEQVQAVKYALAALVDETALDANFPLHDEWEKYPLQLEYFGHSQAGILFYKRLDDLLLQIDKNAEVVEVYYLCLLLGFVGKYKKYYEDQRRGVIEQTAEALRRAGRLQAGGLSPHWRQDDQPPLPAAPGLPRWAVVVGAAALALALLTFLVLKFVVEGAAFDAQQQLLR